MNGLARIRGVALVQMTAIISMIALVAVIGVMVFGRQVTGVFCNSLLQFKFSEDELLRELISNGRAGYVTHPQDPELYACCTRRVECFRGGYNPYRLFPDELH